MTPFLFENFPKMHSVGFKQVLSVACRIVSQKNYNRYSSVSEHPKTNKLQFLLTFQIDTALLDWKIFLQAANNSTLLSVKSKMLIVTDLFDLFNFILINYLLTEKLKDYH